MKAMSELTGCVGPKLEQAFACDSGKPQQQFLKAKLPPTVPVFKRAEDLLNNTACCLRDGSIHLIPTAEMTVGGWPCDTFSRSNNK